MDPKIAARLKAMAAAFLFAHLQPLAKKAGVQIDLADVLDGIGYALFAWHLVEPHIKQAGAVFMMYFPPKAPYHDFGAGSQPAPSPAEPAPPPKAP